MIRHATPSDVEFIYELYFHPDINPFLLYEPMDTADFEPILHFEHRGTEAQRNEARAALLCASVPLCSQYRSPAKVTKISRKKTFGPQPWHPACSFAQSKPG